MALTAEDFVLSPTQLQALNTYIAQRTSALAQADEDMDMPSVEVTLSFSHLWGRSVTVRFDGETQGVELPSDTTPGT